jgi:hypothetical protein
MTAGEEEKQDSGNRKSKNENNKPVLLKDLYLVLGKMCV